MHDSEPRTPSTEVPQTWHVEIMTEACSSVDTSQLLHAALSVLTRLPVLWPAGASAPRPRP